MTFSVERLFDPLALLIVLGGTGAATAIAATREDLSRAAASLRPLLRARPSQDALVADRAVRQIQRISGYKGIVGADRVRTPVDFVHRAARRLAEAEGVESYSAWACDELENRAARHDAVIAVWRSAAEIAPAMGMIGTVLGLILMFGRMNDVAGMGPAMATAMLTTLYGLVLSAGLAGPVAARLERLSIEERRWQERVVARLVALAREEEELLTQWRRRRAGIAI